MVGLERKCERQDWRRLEMYGGKVAIRENDTEDGASMTNETGMASTDALRENTAVAELTERMQKKIGTNGDGKSTVATPDGRSRKK